MRRAGLELRIFGWMIRLACLCLPLFAVPLPGEAVTVARPCKAEPTDEVISYGDFITCEISPVGDSDTFRFAGLPNDKIIILTTRTAGAVSPCIELYGPNGVLVSSACVFGGVVDRVDVGLKQAGTHTILIRDDDFNAIGTYNLNLERVFPLTRFGTAIKYGQTLTGQTIDLVGDLKFFVFSGTKNSKISLQTVRTAGAISPCIELYGPDGVLVSSACVFGGAVNRIDATLTQDGTQTLLVRDDDYNATGTFTITLQCIIGACTDAIPTSLAAAVSPPSLSVPVGTPATAVANVTNAGAPAAADDGDGDDLAAAGGPDALGCTIVPLTGPPLPFFYQPLDSATLQPIGSPNTPFNLLPGTSQPFGITLTPPAALCPTQFTFGFRCSNAAFADTLTGINTLLVTAGPAAACGLRTTASVTQPMIAVGQTLVTGGSATNLGLPGTAADFYVGILQPNNSILFVTSTGIVVGDAANVSSFRPLAVNVPLSAPFSVSEPAVFTHQRTAGDLHGTYVFFVGAVKTGALAGGTIPDDQILSLAAAPYSFP